MIASYEELTPSALVDAETGFSDPVLACRRLQEMAGHDIPDALFGDVLRTLLPALAECGDPDRAVANLGRWADAVGNRRSAYLLLFENPQAAHIVTTILAASQYFAELLIKNPEYLETLTNPVLRRQGRDADSLWADLARQVAIAKSAGAKRDVLRRFKGPEMLRIGARDLLGDAEMAAITREISDFSDVVVQMALQICLEEYPYSPTAFAVIAMGKMGGRELNYSSDVDLIFIHGNDASADSCITLAAAIQDTLARSTSAGYLFRVDLRLRPEGRFGPISRSLESCRAYYESWAEPWERQALIKARAVAGDAELGRAFIDMTQEFVYRPRVEETFVASIRQNKRRIEDKIARAGEAQTNVKEGVGGIRDVEFIVQLLLLLAGGTNGSLRTGNTLEALDRLSTVGLISHIERDDLRASYIFLRTVEHRLQLLDDRAVRSLPRDPRALHNLSRVLGYPDSGTFLVDYQTHTRRVQALSLRLFYETPVTMSNGASDEVAQWVLSPDDERSQSQLLAMLRSYGFDDTNDALRLIERNVAGTQYGGNPPEARAAFANLTSALLAACTQTPRPDAALRGISALADAVPSRAALYQSLSENPELLQRLCTLSSRSGFLWQILLSHLELIDLLADEERMDAPPSIAFGTTREMIARNASRARIQIGARDIWNLADVSQTAREITDAAQATLQSALSLIQDERGAAENGLAIIGLGKLGGAELGYGSDWDVLYVGGPNGNTDLADQARQVEHLLRDELASWRVRFELDARLRPDGRDGMLVPILAAYADYYATRAATWERQALTKARFVAGDATLGEAFMRLVQPFVYGRGITHTETEEVRGMKRRIETERAHSPRDLKLAPGGLADIEWIAQLLQLRWGHARPRLRVPGTLAALRVLRDDALITQSDWETLDATYRLLTHLRNRLYLHAGIASDVPTALSDETKDAMSAVRRLCLRLFYGETA